MRRALFPGTFDPITLGHLDLIARAARVVDELVVLVAAPTHKNCLFTLQERVAMAHSVLEGHKNVRVLPLEGLLVDMVRALDAPLIVRGVRSGADFEYERQVASVHQALYPGLETLYLVASPAMTGIASSFVREVAALKGDVSPFVPPLVVHVLQERFQYGA